MHDMPEDTTVPYAAGDRRGATRGCARCSTRTGGARPTRSGSASTRPAAPVAVVTMADGCDDPRQIDDLARLVDRGVVVAAASRYMPGGQQVGGPRFKRMMSRWAGRSLHMFARVGTRDATNSFKAYDTDFVRAGGHRVADRLRDRARADRQGEPAAPAGRRDPDDLARPPARRVALRRGPVPAQLPALVLLRVRPAADRRAARRRGGPRARPRPSRSGNAIATGKARRRDKGSGHRFGRLHRRVRGRGAARPRARGGRAWTTTRSTARWRTATTTTRGTGSSRATPATSSLLDRAAGRLRPLHRRAPR